MSAESLSPKPEKIGRNYKIDFLDVMEAFMEGEETLLEGLSAEERDNVDLFIDESQSLLKHGRTLRVSEVQEERHSQEFFGGDSGRAGILYYDERSIGYDIVNNSGEVIISSETPVMELTIPQLYIPEGEKAAISPGTVTDSLKLVADRIEMTDMDSQYVIGFTHIRMGNIAARWGFHLQERPFPAEIYKLLDVALEGTESDDLEYIKSVEAYRDQVLVYQTKAEFLERFSGKRDTKSVVESQVSNRLHHVSDVDAENRGLNREKVLSDEFVQRLFEFVSWKDGWDDEGAEPITPSVAVRALKLAQECLESGLEPEAISGKEGSIYLQWHFDDGRLVGFYVDKDGGWPAASFHVGDRISPIEISSNDELVDLLKRMATAS